MLVGFKMNTQLQYTTKNFLQKMLSKFKRGAIDSLNPHTKSASQSTVILQFVRYLAR